MSPAPDYAADRALRDMIQAQADVLAKAVGAARETGLVVDIEFEQTDVEITHMSSPQQARIFERTTVAVVHVSRTL